MVLVILGILYYAIKDKIKQIMNDELIQFKRFRYGLIPRLSKEYDIPKRTIENWADEIRLGCSRQRAHNHREVLVEILGNKCKECGSIDGLDIDHISPLTKGGKNILSNLQLLCKGCHRAKSVYEGKARE